MRKLFSILFAGLGLTLATSTVRAEHFYVAGDVGQIRAPDGACAAIGLAGVAGCKDTATSWRVAGGYEFTRNWAVEISYADYGSANLGLTPVPVTFYGKTVPAGGSLGQWKAIGYEFAGVGTWPVAGGFGVFGKLGIATTRLDLSLAGTSLNKTTAAWGLGAKYDVTRTFGVRAQYERIGLVGVYGATLITVGIMLGL